LEGKKVAILKSQLKPLAPPRQRLAVDPTLAAAAGAAVGVGMTVAGNLISNWVWERYVAPKRKNKHSVKHVQIIDRIAIQVETIEERIVKTRKIRFSLRGKL